MCFKFGDTFNGDQGLHLTLCLGVIPCNAWGHVLGLEPRPHICQAHKLSLWPNNQPFVLLQPWAATYIEVPALWTLPPLLSVLSAIWQMVSLRICLNVLGCTQMFLQRIQRESADLLIQGRAWRAGRTYKAIWTFREDGFHISWTPSLPSSGWVNVLYQVCHGKEVCQRQSVDMTLLLTLLLLVFEDWWFPVHWALLGANVA